MSAPIYSGAHSQSSKPGITLFGIDMSRDGWLSYIILAVLMCYAFRIFKVANRQTIREKVRQIKQQEDLKKNKILTEDRPVDESEQQENIEDDNPDGLVNTDDSENTIVNVDSNKTNESKKTQ